ncbi:MAG: dodecin family protein [Halobacteriales archaeon]|nr:dodecin family protein [Halobacteriales archaeon]
MTMARKAMRKERPTTRVATVSERSDGRHEHRTAKVVEIIGSSRRSFEDAVRGALQDASATTRGISGAHVVSMSVKCRDGEVLEYKVDLRVAFGIERTARP